MAACSSTASQNTRLIEPDGGAAGGTRGGGNIDGGSGAAGSSSGASGSSGSAGSGGSAGAGGNVGSSGMLGSSGSAGAGQSGSGGSAGRAGAGAAGMAGVSGSAGAEAGACEPALLLVLDRSASMQDPPSGGTLTKWNMVASALTSSLSSTEPVADWGLKLFPATGTALCASTDNIDVLIGKNAASACSAAINAGMPNGDSTPTGEAINAATKYLPTAPATGPRGIVVVTDGPPNCAQGAAMPRAESTAYTVTAIQQAASVGLVTFVIGVDATTASIVDSLNQMAIAGGRPRPDPNPAANKFYPGDTENQIRSSISSIVAAACP